jgi:hypothetical protein
MGDACIKCIHFRKMRPRSQSLQREVGTVDAALSNAFSKLAEEDNKIKAAEAQFKQHQETLNRADWSNRPVMTEYCGVNENEGKYWITEIKNRGFLCSEFKKGDLPRKSCSDCTHRLEALGDEIDMAAISVYANWGGQNIGAGVKSPMTDNLMTQTQQGIGPRKALELNSVYMTNGVLATKPKYFDYCELYSNEDDFIICALRNPHHACAGWQKEAPSVVSDSVNVRVSQQPKQPGSASKEQFQEQTEEEFELATMGAVHNWKNYWFLHNGLTLDITERDKHGRLTDISENFQIPNMPLRKWIRLTPHKVAVPVTVYRDVTSLRVKIGSAEQETLPTMESENEWKFDVIIGQLDIGRDHPVEKYRGYKTQLDCGEFIVSQPYKNPVRYYVSGIPLGTKTIIQDPTDGERLPICVYRFQDRLTVEWLTFEMLENDQQVNGQSLGAASSKKTSGTQFDGLQDGPAEDSFRNAPEMRQLMEAIRAVLKSAHMRHLTKEMLTQGLMTVVENSLSKRGMPSMASGAITSALHRIFSKSTR